MTTPKKNRNLFRLSRFILLRIPFFLKFLFKKKTCDKSLLIVSTDAIGDYILCRNFIKIIRHSKRFAGYKIVLLGNVIWKELAISYDNDYVDEFIFIKPEDLYYDPLSTLKIAVKLYKKKFETVLVPCSTRRLINDGFAGISCAKYTIGYISNNEGIYQKYKRYTDKFYSLLIKLPPGVFFEFERNKYFFETVLNEKIPLNRPVLHTAKLKEDYILMALGSGKKERNWDFDKFKDLTNLLIEHTEFKIYIVGGNYEKDLGIRLKKEILSDRVIDLTGETKLTEFVGIVSKAFLVISNETSIMHIANACSIDNIYILGGGHYKRFAPYPSSNNNVSIAVYNEMECYNCNWNCIHKIVSGNPYPCISNISSESVWKKIIMNFTSKFYT